MKNLYDVPGGVVYRYGGPVQLVGTRNDEVVVTWRVSRSFSYEGRHVAKGEVLADDDPLVPIVNKTHPALLLISVRRPGSPPLVGAPTRSEDGIDFRPDLVDRNFELRISSGAREAIRDTIRVIAPHRLETGGLLYSYDRPRYRGVVIDRATDPGPDSILRTHGLRLSSPERIESEFGEIGQRSLANGLRPIGDYHTHPNGNPEPSSDDRKAWARALQDRYLSFYVGVICTRSSDALGWEFPDLHPWVARGGPKGVEILRCRLVE